MCTCMPSCACGGRGQFSGVGSVSVMWILWIKLKSSNSSHLAASNLTLWPSDRLMCGIFYVWNPVRSRMFQISENFEFFFFYLKNSCPSFIFPTHCTAIYYYAYLSKQNKLILDNWENEPSLLMAKFEACPQNTLSFCMHSYIKILETYQCLLSVMLYLNCFPQNLLNEFHLQFLHLKNHVNIQCLVKRPHCDLYGLHSVYKRPTEFSWCMSGFLFKTLFYFQMPQSILAFQTTSLLEKLSYKQFKYGCPKSMPAASASSLIFW